MSCCKQNVLKSTSVEVVDETLEVTIDETILANGCKYRVIIEQNIPCKAVGFPIVIVNGEDKILLWTTGCTRPVFAYQLLCDEGLYNRCGCDYDLSVPVCYVNCDIETNPPHFTACRRLKSLPTYMLV